jgi:hypothetical protein
MRTYFVCRWAIVKEDSADAALREGLMVALIGNGVWFVGSIVNPEISCDRSWKNVCAGHAYEVREGGFVISHLECAVRHFLERRVAERGISPIDKSGMLVGVDGVWQMDVVVTNECILYGWAVCEANWHPVTPYEAMSHGCECVVGGLAVSGRLIGLAECGDDHMMQVKLDWKKRFNLWQDSRFIAKVLLKDGSITLAPLGFVYCQSQELHPACLSFHRGLVFVNQQRTPKSRRIASSENEVGAPDMSASSEASIPPEQVMNGVLAAPVDEDEMQQNMEGGEKPSVVVVEDEGNVVWQKICADTARRDEVLVDRGNAQLRQLLVGNYRPVEGILLASVSRFDCVAPVLSSSLSSQLEQNVEKVRKTVHKRAHSNGAVVVVVETEVGVEVNKGVPRSQLCNQWKCCYSRELIWGSVPKRCIPHQSVQLAVLGAKDMPVALVWQGVEDPKMRTKWDNGSWIEVDVAAVSLWEKLRLWPVVPPKKISYVVFCGENMDRGVRAFFSDVASVWTLLSLGLLAPETPEGAVVEVVEQEDDIAFSERFIAEMRRFFSSCGDQMNNSSAQPLIVFLVWPSQGELSELLPVLEAFNDGCFDRHVVIQVVPEARVSQPLHWNMMELRQFVLDLFSTVRVYKMVSSEPAMLLAHPFLSNRERPSFHVAFALGEHRSLALAAFDPTGEIWSCTVFEEEELLDLGSARIVLRFVRALLPDVADWDVVLLDCSEAHLRLSFDSSLSFPHAASVVLCHVRPSVLFHSDSEERAIATISPELAIVSCGKKSLYVCGVVPGFVIEDLAIMMSPEHGCPHVEFVLSNANMRIK